MIAICACMKLRVVTVLYFKIYLFLIYALPLIVLSTLRSISICLVFTCSYILYTIYIYILYYILYTICAIFTIHVNMNDRVGRLKLTQVRASIGCHFGFTPGDPKISLQIYIELTVSNWHDVISSRLKSLNNPKPNPNTNLILTIKKSTNPCVMSVW